MLHAARKTAGSALLVWAKPAIPYAHPAERALQYQELPEQGSIKAPQPSKGWTWLRGLWSPRIVKKLIGPDRDRSSVLDDQVSGAALPSRIPRSDKSSDFRERQDNRRGPLGQ